MKKRMQLLLIPLLYLSFSEQTIKASEPDDDSNNIGVGLIQQPEDLQPIKPLAEETIKPLKEENPSYLKYFGFKAADTVNSTFWNVFTQIAVKTGVGTLAAKYEWGKTKHMKELEEIDKKTRQYTEQEARSKAKVAKYQADTLIDQQELDSIGKKSKQREAQYQKFMANKAQGELQFSRLSNAIAAADKQVGAVEDLKKEELGILKPLKKESDEYKKQEKYYTNEIANATVVALQLRKDANSAVDLFQYEQREMLTVTLAKRNHKLQKAAENKAQEVELKQLQKRLGFIDISHRSSEKIIKQLKEQRDKKLKHLKKESAEYKTVCEEYAPKIKKKKEELHELGEKRIECLDAINKCETAIALKEPITAQPQTTALSFGTDGHLIVHGKAA